MGKGVAEHRTGGRGLGPSIDVARRTLGFLGEPGDQAPTKRTQPTLSVVFGDGVHPIGRGDVPRGVELLVESHHRPEVGGVRLGTLRLNEAAAHEGIVPAFGSELSAVS